MLSALGYPSADKIRSDSFIYDDDLKLEIREYFKGSGLFKDMELKQLEARAAICIANVKRSKMLPEFDSLQKLQRDKIDALALTKSLVSRNDDVKEAIDLSSQEPPRHDYDSSIFWLAEQFIAGKVKQGEFMNEIFHRVIDQEVEAIEPLTFEKSMKDKISGNRKDGREYMRFRSEYLAEVLQICIRQKDKDGIHKILSHVMNFMLMVIQPVLEASGEKLSPERIGKELYKVLNKQ